MEAQESGENEKERTQTHQAKTSTGTDETSCSLTTKGNGPVSVDETSGPELTQESENDGDIVTKDGSPLDELTVANTKSQNRRIKQNLEKITEMIACSERIVQGNEKKIEEAIALIIGVVQETETVISDMNVASHVLHDIKDQTEGHVIHVTVSATEQKDGSISTSERIQVATTSLGQRLASPATVFATEPVSAGDGTSRTGGTGMNSVEDTHQGRTQMKDASEGVDGDEKSDHYAKGSGEGYGGGDKKKRDEEEEEEEEEEEGEEDGKENEKKTSDELDDKGSIMGIILFLCFHESYFRSVPYSKQRSIHHILSQPNPSIEMRLKDDNILVLHFLDTSSRSTLDPTTKQSLIYTIKVSHSDWEKVPESEKKNVLKILEKPNMFAYIEFVSHNTLELSINPRLASIDESPGDLREQLNMTHEAITSEQTTTALTTEPITATTGQITTNTSEEKPSKKKKKEKHLETDISPEHTQTSKDYPVGGIGDGTEDVSDDEQKITVTLPATEDSGIIKYKLSLELIRQMDAQQSRLIIQQLTDAQLRKLLLLEPHEQIEVHFEIDFKFYETDASNQTIVRSLLRWNNKDLEDILKKSGRGILMFLKTCDWQTAKVLKIMEKESIIHITREFHLTNIEKAKRLVKTCVVVPNPMQLGILETPFFSMYKVGPLVKQGQAKTSMDSNFKLSLVTLRNISTKKCKNILKSMTDQKIIELLFLGENEHIEVFFDISQIYFPRIRKEDRGPVCKALTKLKSEEIKKLLMKSADEIIKELEKDTTVKQLFDQFRTESKLLKMEKEKEEIKRIMEAAKNQTKLSAKEALHLTVKLGFVEKALVLAQQYELITEAITIMEAYGFTEQALNLAMSNGLLDKAIRIASEYNYVDTLNTLQSIKRRNWQGDIPPKFVLSGKLKKLKDTSLTTSYIPLYLSLDVFKAFDIFTTKIILENLTDEDIVELLMLEKGVYMKTFFKKKKKINIIPSCLFKKTNNIVRESLIKLECCEFRHLLANHTGEEILETLKKKSKKVKIRILEIQKQILLKKICEEDFLINLLNTELQKVVTEQAERETSYEEKRRYIKTLISLIDKGAEKEKGKEEEKEEEEEIVATEGEKLSPSVEEKQIDDKVKLYLTYKSLQIYNVSTIRNVFKQLTDRKIVKIFKLGEEEYVEVYVLPRNKKMRKKKSKTGLLGKSLRKLKESTLRKILNLRSGEALERLKTKYKDVAIALLGIDIEDLEDELQSKQSYKKQLEEEIKKMKIEHAATQQLPKTLKRSKSKNKKIKRLPQLNIPSTLSTWCWPAPALVPDSKEIEEDPETFMLYTPYALLRNLSVKVVKTILKRMTNHNIIDLLTVKHNACIKVPFKIKTKGQPKRLIKQHRLSECLVQMTNCRLNKLLRLSGEQVLQTLFNNDLNAEIVYFQIECENLKNSLASEKETNRKLYENIKDMRKKLKISEKQKGKKQLMENRRHIGVDICDQDKRTTIVCEHSANEIEIKCTPSKKTPIITVDIEDSYAQSVHERNLELQINLKPPLKDPKNKPTAVLFYKEAKDKLSAIYADSPASSSTSYKITFSDDRDEPSSSRTLFEIASYQETVNEMNENMLCAKQGVLQDHLLFSKFGCELQNEKTKEINYYKTYLWEIVKETPRISTQRKRHNGSNNCNLIFTFLFIYFMYRKFRMLF